MRVAAIPVVLAGLAFAGCAENYVPIADSEPPQALVRDRDGGLDKRNYAVACASAYGIGYTTVKSQSIDSSDLNGEYALVTCDRP